MQEVKVAYLCVLTETVRPCHRTSDGWFYGWERSFVCIGLLTDTPRLTFTLQDDEQFRKLDQELRPVEWRESNSGRDGEIGNEPGTTCTESYVATQIADALNNAFAQKMNVRFVPAVYGEDMLPYDFNAAIGSQRFDGFEQKRRDADNAVRKEIDAIDRQIKALEAKKNRLTTDARAGHYAAATSDSLKELVARGWVERNAIISNIGLYPLDVAFLQGDTDFYEQLLSQGYVKQRRHWTTDYPLLIDSWYGFFYFFKREKVLVPDYYELCLASLPLLSDGQLTSLMGRAETAFAYKDLIVTAEHIKTFREQMRHLGDSRYYEEVHLGFLKCFERLIMERRFDTITTIKTFIVDYHIFCEYDALLFVDCIRLKDLDALVRLDVTIRKEYLTGHVWTIVNDAVRQFCNVEHLGEEMMAFIEMHAQDD